MCVRFLWTWLKPRTRPVQGVHRCPSSQGWSWKPLCVPPLSVLPASWGVICVPYSLGAHFTPRPLSSLFFLPLLTLSRSPSAALIYIHCGPLKPLLNNEGAWKITTKVIWLDRSLHCTGAIIRQDCERPLHPHVQSHTNDIGRTLVW